MRLERDRSGGDAEACAVIEQARCAAPI